MFASYTTTHISVPCIRFIEPITSNAVEIFSAYTDLLLLQQLFPTLLQAVATPEPYLIGTVALGLPQATAPTSSGNMSFSAVATLSNDKGSDLLGQSCEDLGSEFFDQFLTFSPIDNEGPDYSLESTSLERSLRGSHPTGTSSSLLERDGHGNSIVHRVDAPWAFSQKAALSHHTSTQGSDLYSELSGRAAVSDSDLLSLESISLRSPETRANSFPSPTSSPTSTGNLTVRKRLRLVESLPKLFQKATGSLDKTLRSPIRKAKSSSKMMQASQSFQNFEVWGNNVNSRYQFDFEHPTRPSSPPQSARASDASDNSSSVRFIKEEGHDGFPYNNGSLHHFSDRHAAYDTPLATPVLDDQHSRRPSAQHPFSDPALFPPTPQFHRASGTWSQIPGSSEFGSYETAALHSPNVDPPMWWNHASTAPMAQPSPTAVHINVQRSSKSVAHQLQNGLSYNSNEFVCSSSKIPSGLGIQMTESAAPQSFVVASPQQQSYFTHAQPQSRPQYRISSGQYTSAAPTNAPHSSPMCRPRSEISESESPSPKSGAMPAFQVRKRSTTSKSKHTPRTPSTGAVDFVNFTPNDSRKILTGVAPSGSSKTKARREKEAMEKRRKLSMAALRAVQEAGGDIESLVEQGLFV